jgi:acylphosphatase
VEDEGSMRRVRVVVSGRVQGVFFRVSCAERARALGVAGWVRNTHDRHVEAVFEGPDGAVEAMVAWCRVGPPGAQVAGLELNEVEPVGEDGFKITGPAA